MRYLIILLFSIISVSSFSQTTTPINLDWTESLIAYPTGEKINTLTFTGASLDANNFWLPEYSYLQLTGSTNDLFTVELLDTEFKLLSSAERQILRNKTIPNTIKPSINTVVIRKQNYQQVKFTPIRKNPLTGQLEKLIRFSLKFQKKSQIKSTKQSKSYVNSSVLQSGKWVKIAIDTTAVHKITYSQLIEMGISNPENIRIYGSGGGMLPKMNNEDSLDDLPNNPIYMDKGSDGIFNSGDFILFYAKGPRSWRFDKTAGEFVHENHLYSKFSHYFLSSDMGSPTLIQSATSLPSSNINVTGFDDYAVFDQDNINLLESGRLWLGNTFDVTTNYSFNFSFPNLKTSEPLSISTNLVARSSSATKFSLLSGTNSIGEVEIPSVNTGSYTASYASSIEKKFINFTPSSANFELSLDYAKSSPSSKGWLNFLRVNVRRNLIFTNNQMAFRDSKTIGAGNNALFSLQNTNDKIQIWDVTSPQSAKIISANYSNNKTSFIADASSLKEYVAFDHNGYFPTPINIGSVKNQNLHALAQTDMIILSPPKFLSYAVQIADFHRTKDNLKVSIIDPEEIYNEFSSGSSDVSAIRNFVKMFYDRSTSELDMPKYLLLFGDGSFDNKSDRENNTNQVLTYQSENSLSPTQSFVTDDFFGLLDDDEGEATGMVDIGIGRFPVNTAEEAQIVTSKILNYNNSEWGDWRSMICFIGDDEDNNTHMRDANKLAVQVETDYPQFKIQRIFLDDYEQITSSAGQEYPDVNLAIGESINKGSLLMNYTGHGNENGLAHEHILMLDDILSWKNPTKLPLFMTATCEFSRFDNYKKLSSGEMILLRGNGGGIGLFTTTRLVFSSPNFSLNQNFYHHVFDMNSEGKHLRLGDIMRKTKNETGSGINKRNFTLLGDPALTLNYPKYTARTIQINDVDISQATDTLKALSKVHISGDIIANTGEILNDFSGTVYPTIYDKATTKSTRGNDGEPFEYTTQNSVLFKGKASVTDGNFNFNFLVPKDINYQYGNGKISYYANSMNSDAAGYSNRIVVGGTNPNADEDKIGPEIELYMDDEQFTSGGLTSSSPLLLAIVQDSSGINTVGNSIGHDIIAILDQKTDQPYKLNDSYESDLDNYQKGKISYRLLDLETGEHEIQIKVWDNANNSSENMIDFIVADNADLILKHVLNYPNPFTTSTGFYFEHNQASRNLDVLIQILTISGKLIKTIETTINSTANRVGPIQWDGKDDFGNSIGRGVYFYRVKVRADDGKVVNKFQKLVILK
ncbi:type IX secretion system sortase PorU [Labilibaculum sp.]|uniref:type IX secretion system sortase PorU n=1 Tax=Labilibaculum sp. TaxID=2060723 RepID=UPI002AA6A500|nr:type IX secretion system sortase PorU [Labilibaculum sp.]